jgi:hypothetical protein
MYFTQFYVVSILECQRGAHILKWTTGPQTKPKGGHAKETLARGAFKNEELMMVYQ